MTVNGRRLAAALCLALLAPACGTRLPIRAAGSVPSSDDLSGTEATGGADTTTDASAASAATATGTTGAAGPASAVARKGGSLAAPLPQGGNGGATDVGVTASEIRIGNVSAITGPLPDQFRPSAEGAQAYLEFVNAQGGIYGRKLSFISCDDELNGQKRIACLKSLAEDKKVFAFVGNLSAADDNDAGYLDGQLKGVVPDVGGFALSYSRSQSNAYWSPMGALRRELAGTAQWEWIRNQTHWNNPMVFWHNILISREQGQTVAKELATVLGRPCTATDCSSIWSKETSPLQTDYNSDVLDAKRRCIDSFFTSMEIASNIRLVRAIANYVGTPAPGCPGTTWDPTIHFELSTYSSDFVKTLGPMAKNVWIRIPHVPFSEPGFAPMGEYLTALKKYFPNSVPTSFGLFGWVGAEFFVQAALKAGPNLTRAKLVEAMKTFVGANGFTANGLIGPNDNVRVQPFSCHVITRVTDAGGVLDFRRQSGPGWVCSKTYVWR